MSGGKSSYPRTSTDAHPGARSLAADSALARTILSSSAAYSTRAPLFASPEPYEDVLQRQSTRDVVEPGALPVDGTVDLVWRPHPVAVIPPGFSDPDEYAKANALAPEAYMTATFSAPPTAITIPAGTTVYRVIGLNDHGEPTVNGRFWSLSPPPATEAEWRARDAVCGHWNGDGGYVAVVLPEPINVWSGPIAPHYSAAKDYYLPGGGQQLYIPRETIDLPKWGIKLADVLHRTPWNKKT